MSLWIRIYLLYSVNCSIDLCKRKHTVHFLSKSLLAVKCVGFDAWHERDGACDRLAEHYVTWYLNNPRFSHISEIFTSYQVKWNRQSIIYTQSGLWTLIRLCLFFKHYIYEKLIKIYMRNPSNIAYGSVSITQAFSLLKDFCAVEM